VGGDFLYTVTAADADVDDILEITLEPITAPAWLRIEPTGDRQAELKGTPGAEHVGSYEFVVIVRDRAGAEDRLDFAVQVVGGGVMSPDDGINAAGDGGTVEGSTTVTSTAETVTN
jgi:hypothetical protein